MGMRLFGTVCLILAALFTLAAVKGVIANSFGAVLILPAVAAIALIVVGIYNYRSAS